MAAPPSSPERGETMADERRLTVAVTQEAVQDAKALANLAGHSDYRAVLGESASAGVHARMAALRAAVQAGKLVVEQDEVPY